jgi:hypothetical protein
MRYEENREIKCLGNVVIASLTSCYATRRNLKIFRRDCFTWAEQKRKSSMTILSLVTLWMN